MGDQKTFPIPEQRLTDQGEYTPTPAKRLTEMETDHNQANTLHLKGLACRRSGNVKLAIESFQQAIAMDGDRAEFHKNLGNAYGDDRQWDLARQSFQSALRLAPMYLEAWYDMGCALQSGGFITDAINCYRNVLELDPCHSDSLNNLGLILEAKGQSDQALSCYRRAVQNDSAHYVALNNLGNMFRTLGKLREALSCYERAIAVNPAIADAHNNKGFALWDLGRDTESIASFATACRLAPESDSILINYANALLAQGRPRQALACYKRVALRHPQNKQAALNMGLCHESLDNPALAIACYRQALAIDRNYAKAQSLLVALLKRTCQWEELKTAGKKLDHFTAAALEKGEKPAETPFLNISRHIHGSLNYRVAQAWSTPLEDRRRHTFHPTNEELPFKGTSPSRLTIGYLSCNFRNHPTAQLMAGLLGRHDRKRFKVMCYSYGIDDGSRYREQIKQSCDHFVDLRGIGDDDAATRIRTDDVHILVDLGGHTKDSRLGIAARHPAPLQVRYLGLAGTTGASFFDYLVTDKIVTPKAQAAHYSEKFLYMPHCYQVNNYREEHVLAGMQRSDFGLPQEEHVYCAFHAPYKIDTSIFQTWMRILKSVRKSVLWLGIGENVARTQLTEYAKRNGIDPHRLIFADNLPKHEHLNRLRLADTALDTIQVTGAATTSDALWAGVPVVTMMGRHFASRMSASILNAAGLPQLVTQSLKAYETLAVQLAMDQGFSTKIRDRLHTARIRSPLFDTLCFTRNLERGYEMIWNHYVFGRQPSMMDVPDAG